MIHRAIAVAFAIVLAVTAVRAQTNEVMLSVEQTINILSALSALDGQEQPGKDGAKIVVPYKLSAPTRMTVAINLDRARTVFKAYQTAHAALIAELSGGGTQVPEAAMPKFTAEINKVLQAPSTVSLLKIKKDDLNLGENSIPVSSLSHLVPILY